MVISKDITAAIGSNSAKIAMTGDDYFVTLAAGTARTYSGSMTGTGTLRVSGDGAKLILTGTSSFINAASPTLVRGSFIAGSPSNYEGYIGHNFRGSLYTITKTGAPTVVIDKGATLQYGITTSATPTTAAGIRGGIYQNNWTGYNVANVEVNGTLRVEYTGYGVKLGILSGTGDLVMAAGAMGFLVGENTISGTIVNTTELFIGSNNIYGSIDKAKVLWNNGTLLFNTPYDRVLEISHNIFENKWGNDINFNDNGGLIIMSGVYSYSDSKNDNTSIVNSASYYSLNPRLSDESLNYTAIFGNNSGRGINIEGGTVQLGNGKTTKFFLPGNDATAYIDLRSSGVLAFNYSNSGPTYLNTTIAGGGLSFYALRSAGDGDVIFKQGHIVVTAQQYYNGKTQINAGATLQLGDGTNGDTASTSKGLFQSTAGDGGIMQAGEVVTVRGIDGRSGSTSTGAWYNETINNGRIIVDNVGATYLTRMSGTGTLVQAGAGVTTLGSMTGFTGAIGIYGGTLALGAGSSVATSSGVTLYATTASPAYGTQSKTAQAVAVGAATFDVSRAGAQTIKDLDGVAGTKVQLGGNTLTIGDETSTTYAGVIADGGLAGGTGGGITKAGSGTLTLTGVETYTGTTTIAAGTLTIGKGGSIAASTAVVLRSAGSKLVLSGAASYEVHDLGGVAGTTVQASGRGLIVSSDESTTYSGTILSGGLVKQGAGTLTFTSAQHGIDGDVVVLGGTLKFENNASLSGYMLKLGGAGSVVDLSNAADWMAIESIGGAAGSTLMLSDGILQLNAQHSMTFAGTIADGTAGDGGIQKRGSQTLTLSGSNTFTGGIAIESGTLRLTSDAAAGGGTITFTKSNATLILDQGTDNLITSIKANDRILLGGFTRGDALTYSYDDSSGLFFVSDQHGYSQQLHFSADQTYDPMLANAYVDWNGYAILTAH